MDYTLIWYTTFLLEEGEEGESVSEGSRIYRDATHLKLH